MPFESAGAPPILEEHSSHSLTPNLRAPCYTVPLETSSDWLRWMWNCSVRGASSQGNVDQRLGGGEITELLKTRILRMGLLPLQQAHLVSGERRCVLVGWRVQKDASLAQREPPSCGACVCSTMDSSTHQPI